VGVGAAGLPPGLSFAPDLPPNPQTAPKPAKNLSPPRLPLPRRAFPQGEGGCTPSQKAFLSGLRRLCDEAGALLVFDEVQCGLGRTGKLWGYEHYGVEPDLMSLAKPLAGGLPIGAVLLKQKVADVMKPGEGGGVGRGSGSRQGLGGVLRARRGPRGVSLTRAARPRASRPTRLIRALTPYLPPPQTPNQATTAPPSPATPSSARPRPRLLTSSPTPRSWPRSTPRASACAPRCAPRPRATPT
jgi:hypothetical protein